MIDILFIGTILSYLQYNSYVNDFVQTKNDFTISRYQYIIVYLYQYINTLLILTTIVYSIYMIELLLIGVKKQYNLIYLILEFIPYYKDYFINENTFLQKIIVQFFIGLILNYFIIILLVIFRGSSKENTKRIIKQDLILFTLSSFIINILLYVFL